MSYDIHVCTSPTLLLRYYKYIHTLVCWDRWRLSIHLKMEKKYLISHSCKYFCAFWMMKYEMLQHYVTYYTNVCLCIYLITNLPLYLYITDINISFSIYLLQSLLNTEFIWWTQMMEKKECQKEFVFRWILVMKKMAKKSRKSVPNSIKPLSFYITSEKCLLCLCIYFSCLFFHNNLSRFFFKHFMLLKFMKCLSTKYCGLYTDLIWKECYMNLA